MLCVTKCFISKEHCTIQVLLLVIASLFNFNNISYSVYEHGILFHLFVSLICFFIL